MTMERKGSTSLFNVTVRTHLNKSAARFIHRGRLLLFLAQKTLSSARYVIPLMLNRILLLLRHIIISAWQFEMVSLASSPKKIGLRFIDRFS